MSLASCFKEHFHAHDIKQNLRLLLPSTGTYHKYVRFPGPPSHGTCAYGDIWKAESPSKVEN